MTACRLILADQSSYLCQQHLLMRARQASRSLSCNRAAEDVPHPLGPHEVHLATFKVLDCFLGEPEAGLESPQGLYVSTRKARKAAELVILCGRQPALSSPRKWQTSSSQPFPVEAPNFRLIGCSRLRVGKLGRADRPLEQGAFACPLLGSQTGQARLALVVVAVTFGWSCNLFSTAEATRPAQRCCKRLEL